MRLQEELAQYASQQDTIITVGVFDGVHLGHKHLLARLKAEAQRRKAMTCAVTFRDHPRTVLYPELAVGYLTSPEERIGLLKEAGVDLVAPLTFDEDLSQLRAREFVSLLQEHLRMKGLVTGPDFAIGYRREGDAKTLRVLGQEMGFSLDSVEPLTLGDLVVSSTAIREALARGDVDMVAALLGRNFSLTGKVTRGARRGKRLGFPTANLDIPQDRAIPSDGIYATWAYVGQGRFMSATNIGVRPTFEDNERVVEAFILDFKGSLYGMEVRLEFSQRLRDEFRFDSMGALQAQMARDVEQAKAILQWTSRKAPLPGR